MWTTRSIESTIQFTIERELTAILPFLDTRITQSQRWIPVNHGVLKEHTHGQVPGLQATSPLWRTRWQWPGLCSTRHNKGSAQSPGQGEGEGEGACYKGPPKQWVSQRSLFSKTDTYITATTTRTRHTHSHSNTSLYTLLVRDNSEAPLRNRMCLQPHRTLRQTLVRLKDQTPIQQRACVMYQIPGGTCSKVYIGQMSRTLEHRLKKHKRARW